MQLLPLLQALPSAFASLRPALLLVATLIAGAVLPGCGGSTHRFLVDGQEVGNGECHGNECVFRFGKPVVDAVSATGTAKGPLALAPDAVARLVASPAPQQLVVDGRPVPGIELGRDGVIREHGAVIGRVDLDAAAYGTGHAPLVDVAGRPLHLEDGEDGFALGVQVR